MTSGKEYTISLSYIKLLGKPYLYLLKTSNLPNLIIFDFHLHDLFQRNSSNKIHLEKFPILYQRIFKGLYQERNINGLYLLDELITVLQKRGYVFLKLIDKEKKVYEPNEIRRME